jgi:hypothetical protein
MEFVDLLYLVVVAILAILIFMQRWSWLGHGDGLQKEKTVILPPYWAARLAAWFAFAEGKFREKDIISQWRRFDVLLAAKPEKILDRSWTWWTTFRRTSPMTP